MYIGRLFRRGVADSAASPAGEDGHILVIADARPHEPLAAAVAGLGYTVASCTAADVERAAPAWQPRAIVLDVSSMAPARVPVLVARLRARGAAFLVVVVPADDTEVGCVALDAGADDFLRRPVASSDLRARVRSHLGPRRPVASPEV